MQEDLKPYYRKGKGSCIICDKPITQGCKYCTSHRYVTQLGEKSVNWKGDNAKDSALKRRARQIKKGTKCEICNKENKILDVHHKDKKRTNNEDNNLILVCRKCHSDIHKDIHPRNAQDGRFERNDGN